MGRATSLLVLLSILLTVTPALSAVTSWSFNAPADGVVRYGQLSAASGGNAFSLTPVGTAGVTVRVTIETIGARVESPANGVLTFSTDAVQYFQIRPTTASEEIQIRFTVEGNGEPAAPTNTVYNAGKVTFSFGATAATLVGALSSTFSISPTVSPVVNPITLKLVADGVTFTPENATWSSSTTATNFRFRSIRSGKVLVTPVLIGADKDSYDVSAAAWNVTVNKLGLDVDNVGSVTYGSRVTVRVSITSSPVESVSFRLTSNAITFDAPATGTLTAAASPFVSQVYLSGTVTSYTNQLNVTIVDLSGPDVTNDRIADTYEKSVGTVQKLAVTLPTFPTNLRLGVWSAYTVISISGTPLQALTLTLKSENNTIEFDPATIVFDRTVTAASVRVRAVSMPLSDFKYWAELSGDDAVNVNTLNITSSPVASISKPQVRVPNAIGSLSAPNTYYGYPIRLDYPPQTSLTVKINVTRPELFDIEPSSVTFTPTNYAATFRVIPKAGVAGASPTLNYYLEGPDADSFTLQYAAASLTLVFNGQVDKPAYTTNVEIVAGQRVGPFTLDLNAAPPAGQQLIVDLTSPAATGFPDGALLIEPTSLTFDSTTLSAQYYVTGRQYSGSAIPLSYAIRGSAAGLYTLNTPTTSFVVSARTGAAPSTWFSPAISSSDTYIVGTTYGPYSIRLPTPPVTGQTVTVALSAPGITFNPATLTYNAGEDFQTFTFTPNVVASSSPITMALTGGSHHTPFTTTVVTIAISGKTFDNAATATVAGELIPGVESALYSIKLNHDVTDLTVTPSSPGLTFTPASLHFGAGDKVKTFTVTATGILNGAQTITFGLTGTDAPYFASNPNNIVTTGSLVPLRSFTINVNGEANFRTNAVTVGTKVRATISIDKIVPSGVTVTPSATGVVFDPPQFVFDATTTLVSFTATPTVQTSVADLGNTDSGSTIVYAISGADAALFNPIPTDTVRALAVATPGIANSGTDVNAIGTWTPATKYSVTTVAHTGEITYTLSCTDAAVTFEPASWTINNGANSRNASGQTYFKVKGDKAGVFEILVTISGSGAADIAGTDRVFRRVIQFAPYTLNFPNNWPTSAVKAGNTYPLPANAQLAVWATAPGSTDVVAPSATITVRPSAPGVTFIPEELVIGGTVSRVPFSFKVNTFNGAAPIFVTYTFSGATEYYTTTYTPVSFTTSARTITFTGAPASLAVGTTNVYSVTFDSVPSNLVITPKFAYGTFTPASITLAEGATHARFQVDLNKDIPFDSNSNADFRWAAVLSGTDAPLYGTWTDREYLYTTSIVPRTISTTIDSATGNTVYLGDVAYVSVNVNNPLTDPLVITPVLDSATGVTVTPTSLTLDKGVNSGSFKFAIGQNFPANRLGSSGAGILVYWKQSGVNSVNTFFSNPQQSIIVEKLSIASNKPASHPYGVWSDDWQLVLNFPAPAGLTVTPSAHPNVVFEPKSWTFQRGETRQAIKYFVKEGANAAGVFVGASNFAVSFVLSGDAAAYVTPLAADTVSVTNAAFGATNAYSLAASYPSTNVYVGTALPFTVELGQGAVGAPELAQGLDVTVRPFARGVEFTPAEQTLTATSSILRFSALVRDVDTSINNQFDSLATYTITVAYQLTGKDADLFSLSTNNLNVQRRAITYGDDPSLANLVVGRASGLAYFEVANLPTTGSVTVDIITTSNIVATPSSVTFSSTSASRLYFTLTGNAVGTGSTHFQITGPASNLYYFASSLASSNRISSTISAVAISFATTPGAITNLVPGTPTPYTLQLSAPAPVALEVGLWGTGFSFYPSVVSFAPGQTIAQFTLSLDIYGAHALHFNISGAAKQYYTFSPANFRLFKTAKRTVSFNLASDVTVGTENTATITLNNPVLKGLTITPQATGVVFTPAVWTFSPSESTITQYITYKASAVGKFPVSFVLSGDDADMYSIPQIQVVSSIAKTITVDAISDNTFGASSSTLWATVNYQPAAGETVTFTPTSNGLVFTPAALTFDNTVKSVSFNVKYAKVGTHALTWAVSGTATGYYPLPTTIVTVNRGTLTANLPTYIVAGTTSSVQTATLAAPANIVVTPISAGVVFNPATWDFSATSQVQYTVTSGAKSFNGANARVFYTASGTDAAAVTLPNPVNIYVDPRYVNVPTYYYVSSGVPTTYRVYVSDAPATALRIRVIADGLILSNSTLVLGPNKLSATFTITAPAYAGSASANQYKISYAIDSTSEDAEFYAISTSVYSVAVEALALSLPGLSVFTTTPLIVGLPSRKFTASIPVGSVTDLVVTPSAPGFTFEPATWNFASTSFVDYTITATAPSSGVVATLALSGADAGKFYYDAPTLVSKLNTFVVDSVTNIASQSGPYSRNRVVSIEAPILGTGEVTLTLKAPGVTFTPSTLTFNKDVSMQTVSIETSDASGLGTYLSFVVGGSLAPQFAIPAPSYTFNMDSERTPITAVSSIAITVGGRNFGSYALSVDNAVKSELTITPAAPGVTFTPAVFPVGSRQALFRITGVTRALSSIPVYYTSSDASYYVDTPTTITAVLKTITAPDSYDSIKIGKTSATYALTLDLPPTQSLTVTPWGAGLVFTPASLTFTPTDYALTFTVKASAANRDVNVNIPIRYLVSGDSAAEYKDLAGSSITVQPYTITAASATAVLGIPSAPFQVYLQDAPIAPVTVTPSAYGAVFSPASFTFSPDVYATTFNITASYRPTAGSLTVNYVLSGDGAAYTSPLTSSVTVNARTLTVPTTLGNLYYGVESTSYAVTVDYLPQGAGSVVVTPSRAGVIFTPASLTFSRTSAFFQQFTAKVVTQTRAATSVTYTLTGDDGSFYAISGTGTTTLTPEKRTIDAFVAATGSLKPGQPVWIDISSRFPVAGGVVIKPTGAAAFNPPSVSLNGTDSYKRIAVTPLAIGATTIKFSVFGDDAAIFNPIDPVTLTVVRGTFTRPASVYSNSNIAPLEGFPSGSFRVSVNPVPPTDVSLIPSSPYLTFNPPVLTFTPTKQFAIANFTVSSRYASLVTSHTISWVVGGTNANLYTAPTASSAATGAVSTPYYTIEVDTAALPTTLAVGVASPQITVRAVPAPINGITLTPYNAHNPTLTFSRETLELTAENPSATFTFTGVVPSAASTLEFSLTGPDSYLYARTISIATPAIVLRTFQGVSTSTAAVVNTMGNFVVGQNTSFTRVALDFAPESDVTLSLSSPSAHVRIVPSTLTFTPTSLNKGFVVYGTKLTPTTPTGIQDLVYFAVSGTDASKYAPPSALGYTFSAITLSQTITGFASAATYTLSSDRPYQLVITANYPLPRGVSVTVSAPAGYTVTPSTIQIVAGARSASATVTAVGLGGVNAPVSFTISGADAGVVSAIAPVTFASSAPYLSVSGLLTSNANKDIGVPLDVVFVLSRPSKADITITVSGISIAPIVIPAGHITATASWTPSQAGYVAWQYAVSGEEALAYSPDSALSFAFNVLPRKLETITTGTLSDNAITVGGWSRLFEFKTVFGSSGSSAPTPSSFNVTFITSGNVEVDTPVIVVSYPASTFSFRVSPKTLGTHAVTFRLVGPDAGLYQEYSSGMNQADKMKVVVTANRRAFSIQPAGTTVNPSAAGVVDKALNRLSGSSILQLYVGVESRPITVSVGAIATKVQLVPQGRGLIFNPSVISFTGTYESLQFTATATEAFSGATYIHFSVIGEDAGLFDIPSPVAIATHHQFIVPEFPVLTVNSPVTLQISIASNFTHPVVLTPSSSNVVFIPETWLFTPQQKTVTFQAIGTSSYDPVGTANVNPIIISDSKYHNKPNSQPFQLAWRYMHESYTVANRWYFPRSAVSLNVLPAGFVVSFPHLQIGQASTLTISTTAPPRSDVVLTLIGNNLNFNPPNILFTASRTTATVSVSAAHADYKDSENIPFTVDYIISGSNSADFIAPAQTFLAVSRGTAAQADSLMLSDATSHAASYALLLVVAVLALLF